MLMLEVSFVFCFADLSFATNDQMFTKRTVCYCILGKNMFIFTFKYYLFALLNVCLILYKKDLIKISQM